MKNTGYCSRFSAILHACLLCCTCFCCCGAIIVLPNLHLGTLNSMTTIPDIVARLQAEDDLIKAGAESDFLNMSEQMLNEGVIQCWNTFNLELQNKFKSLLMKNLVSRSDLIRRIASRVLPKIVLADLPNQRQLVQDLLSMVCINWWGISWFPMHTTLAVLEIFQDLLITLPAEHMVHYDVTRIIKFIIQRMKSNFQRNSESVNEAARLAAAKTLTATSKFTYDFLQPHILSIYEVTKKAVKKQWNNVGDILKFWCSLGDLELVRLADRDKISLHLIRQIAPRIVRVLLVTLTWEHPVEVSLYSAGCLEYVTKLANNDVSPLYEAYIEENRNHPRHVNAVTFVSNMLRHVGGAI